MAGYTWRGVGEAEATAADWAEYERQNAQARYDYERYNRNVDARYGAEDGENHR